MVQGSRNITQVSTTETEILTRGIEHTTLWVIVIISPVLGFLFFAVSSLLSKFLLKDQKKKFSTRGGKKNTLLQWSRLILVYIKGHKTNTGITFQTFLHILACNEKHHYPSIQPLQTTETQPACI